MKAIVHIGAPKTGSSTIQEFLFQNTDRLARQGYRFHRNVPGRGSQYEYPSAALASIDRLLPGRDEQTRYSSTDLPTHQAAGQATVAQLSALRSAWTEEYAIFSSEHIYPWITKPEEIQALDRIFSAQFSQVRYILYIRNQEDLIVSEYSEVLKRGANLRLQQLLEQRRGSLDWEPRIRNWVSVVGRERFDLRLMDSGFLVGGDLLADFASACGFALDELQVPPRINESLSAPEAEALRFLNERIPAMLHDGRPNPLRNGILWNLQNIGPESAPALYLTAEQRAQVQALVGEANERLRRDFFPDRISLFTAPKERPVVDREAVLEHAADLLSRLFIRSRLGRMRPLSPDETERSVQRAPGGLFYGVAAVPKPTSV